MKKSKVSKFLLWVMYHVWGMRSNYLVYNDEWKHDSVLNIFKLSKIAIFYFCLAKHELLKKRPIGDFWVAILATFIKFCWQSLGCNWNVANLTTWRLFEQYKLWLGKSEKSLFQIIWKYMCPTLQHKGICDAIKQNESELEKNHFLLSGIF